MTATAVNRDATVPYARRPRYPWHMAALVIAAILWGTTTSFTKYVLGVFPPITLLIIELALVNVVLWPLVVLRRRLRRRGGRGILGPAPPTSTQPPSTQPPPTRPALWRLAVLGLLEPALTYGGLTVGLTVTSAANASLLGSFETPFVVLLAVVLLRERLTWRRAIGTIVAVAGVAVLDDVRHLFALNTGDLLILGGALTAAAYTLLASRLAGEMDPLEMTAYQFAFGLLFTAPIWLALFVSGQERLSTPIEPHHWAIVLVIGVTEFAISYVLFNFAVRAVSAGTAVMTLNLVPLFGVLAAIVILNEPITASQAVGSVLILAGMVTFSSAGEPNLVPESARDGPATTGAGVGFDRKVDL
jgi:drug/metabolite transporter (DMT)-like permease